MQFSLSGSLATMANGLPYSIGAAVAYPGRQVVCVVGDGGLTMLMGEIATLVKYKLRSRVIVIKNNVLGQIKWEQMILEGNPEFGVELEPIDFAKVAKLAERRATPSSDPRTRSAFCAKRWLMMARRWCRRSSIPTSRQCPERSRPNRRYKFAKSLAARTEGCHEDHQDRWRKIKSARSFRQRWPSDSSLSVRSSMQRPGER